MIYLKQSVYEATRKRLDFIFSEFENIYVSFSGGKDSGLLLNIVLQYMREHGITRKIGVFHQDFEAQYSDTTRYVERTLSRDLDLIQPWWVCLPMRVRTATSMFDQYWIPWDQEKRDIWVRPLPDNPGVITEDNNPFDFYIHGMYQEDLYREFTRWYHRVPGGGRGRTISLVAIRAQESLNRWRAVTSDKPRFKGMPWTTQADGADGDVWAGYPIYDWTVEDVWVANARFEFDYNRLYDLFHYAGLSPHEMRVASPFNDFAIHSLKLYQVIEPGIWGKVVGRVNGANFAAIYGGTHAVGWKSIKLPPGHTWKSFVAFLLATLPEQTRKSYEEKFATSLEFWRTKGGVLSAETIAELRGMGVNIKERGKTNYNTEKSAVTFEEYPDDLDVKDFQTVPSYKRMAVCILKNDHLCKYMGFSQTKKELERRKEAIAKYMSL